MTGDYFISYDFLKSIDIYSCGIKVFNKFPYGGKYKEIIDYCEEYGSSKLILYATLLIDKLGSTKDVRIIYGDTYKDCDIVFAGSIIVKDILYARSIYVGGNIDAYNSIYTDDSINAGRYIKACGSIEARGSINTGFSISSFGCIKSCGNINAGHNIESDKYIDARGAINAGGKIESRYGIMSSEGKVNAGEHIRIGF